MAEPTRADRRGLSQPVPLAPLPDRDRLRQPPPAPLTSFVGREGDVAAICALVRRHDVRLVTLTGPGGVGKTRLALRVIEELEPDFSDGVVFIPLAPVTDPGLVASTIALALGVRDVGERRLPDRLADALRERRLLLVLDNVEQVADAAPLVGDLLAACPRLKALATSRTVLHLYGERNIPVPPLALPDPRRPPLLAEAATAEAVRLFVERAEAAKPGFTLSSHNVAAVAEICRRLDGLPLAIELAAARVVHLTPAALLARLETRLPLLTGGARNRPERLRTMRAAIAWSYDLLRAEERVLFRRLSVFVGGFTLAAAEAVARGEGERGEGGENGPFSLAPSLPRSPSILDGIASLVDQSLLRPQEGREGEAEDAEPRYAMLETMREYGLEQLAASGEEEPIRAAHAAWCLGLVEQAEPALQTSEQVSWLNRLEVEQPNLRAALAWSLAGDDPDVGRRMAAALGWFWWACGDPGEGRAWMQRALARSAGAPARTRARLQTQLAEILWALGDYGAATALDEEALTAWRALGDKAGVAACLLNLGRVAQDEGDYARAAGFDEESLVLHRALGDDSNVARCLCNLGMVVMLGGDLDRAAVLQEEALGLARRLDLLVHVAKVAYNLGEVHRRRGDLARATSLYRESLARHRELRERRFVAEALRGLAVVAAALGEAEAASRLAGADAAVRGAIGAPITPEPERIAFEHVLDGVRAHLGDATFAAAWAGGRGMNPDDAIAAAAELAARLERRAMAGPAPPVTRPGGLSARELDVLRLLAAGGSDREIGKALFISHRTVNGHVAKIFAKLGVRSRAETAVEAVRLGLLAPGPTRPDRPA